MTVWKWQNQGDAKKINGCQGFGGKEGLKKVERRGFLGLWHYSGYCYNGGHTPSHTRPNTQETQPQKQTQQTRWTLGGNFLVFSKKHILGRTQQNEKENPTDLCTHGALNLQERCKDRAPKFQFAETVSPCLSSVLHIAMVVGESIPRQVDEKSGGPQGEKGLEFSRKREGQTFFPLYIP